MRHYVFRGLAALALCFSVLVPAAQAQNATLTITTNGPVSGAVGVQGPNGNVCNPNPGGGPGGGTCTFTYPVNTPLRIAANSPNPAPGFFHGGTGDAAACATSICNIVLNVNSAITVTFDPSQGPIAAIQTTLIGDGKGNVGVDNSQCQNFELGYSACTNYYAVGSEVRLQGRSMPGNIFAGFSGGAGDASVCGGDSTCTFSATGNTSVNASFSALVSVAVTPPSSTITVGNTALFSSRGTFANGMQRFGFGGNGTPWQSHVSMDAARFGLGAAVVNDRLYAIGGVDASGPLASVEVFDPTIIAIMDFPLVWTPRASMATARESHAAAVVNGRIYAIGGRTTGGGAVSSMESYDPAGNTWSARASLSGSRAGMAAAVIGNTIYVVGGSDAGGVALSTVEAYDVATDTWSLRAPMSVARSGAGAAVVNGILYVMSGDAAGSVEAYDPATNTWTSKTAMPSGGGMQKAVSLNGLIYAVGGPSATIKVYNPATDSWLTLNNMPSPLSEFGLAVLDGRLFAAGGLSGGTNAVATVNANRPPEATWWSSNSAVGRINSNNNGNVNGLAVGTATISARLAGIDSGANSALLTVTSNVPNPGQIFLNLPNAAFTDVGNPNWGCGSFMQSNANGPYTVTVDYGDGSGVQNLPFTPNPPANSPCAGPSSPKGVFFFNHAYSSAGLFHVTVTVRNTSTNQTATGGFNVEVQDNGGGGDECVALSTNVTAVGTVPFATVHLSAFDRTTGDPVGEGDIPFGAFTLGEIPAGSYHIELSVPAGYTVSPSSFDIDPACGDSITLSATVQAIPAVPPTITLQLSPDVIWPPNNKMVSVTATINASSPDGHATSVELVSITSNEADTAFFGGAALGTDDRAFELRAKRNGGGTGRIYTVTYRATDTVTGLSTLVTGTVVVPHDQGK